MEVRELISFYHVARMRSVSKAAEYLEIGQPTVTTHLQKIEKEFGVVLFDRIKRPIQMTSEGIRFYELTRPVVEGITEGMENLKTQMDYPEHRGSFIIGDGVKGGMYGEYPSLKDEDLLEGDLQFNVDFRSVYSTMLEKWLGLDPDPIVGGQFERLAFL